MALLADNALRFHLFDDTRGTVIANAELALHPGNRRFTLLGHKADRLIEQRIQLFTAVETTAAAFAFAVGGNAVNILRTTAGFPVLNHSVDFLVANKRPMDAHRRGGVRPGVEHIPHPEQRFRTALIENGTRVNFTRHGKGDTRRNVGLNQTGNDIHRRTLRRQHQVDPRRTRFLCQASDQLFHLLTDGHHQVGEFVHQHHYVRQLFQYRVHGIHTVAWLPVWIRDRTAHACRFSNLLVIARQITYAQRRH